MPASWTCWTITTHKREKNNEETEQFEKSRYFNKKYGKLEYVSESGNVYKTDKGKVLMFVKEFNESDSIEDKVFDKWERMSDEIISTLNFEEVAKNVARKYFPRYADQIANYLKNNIELICTDGYAEDWTEMENCLRYFTNDNDIQISDLA